MAIYKINKAFATDEELQDWCNENLQKHEDGYRRLYNGEVVMAINCEQSVDVVNMKRGMIFLDSVQTYTDPLKYRVGSVINYKGHECVITHRWKDEGKEGATIRPTGDYGFEVDLTIEQLKKGERNNG